MSDLVSNPRRFYDSRATCRRARADKRTLMLDALGTGPPDTGGPHGTLSTKQRGEMALAQEHQASAL